MLVSKRVSVGVKVSVCEEDAGRMRSDRRSMIGQIIDNFQKTEDASLSAFHLK